MPRSNTPPMGELALIEHIRRSFPGNFASSRGIILGIGDDCAILRPPRGHEVLITTDFSLENRHFRRDLHPPRSAGHRCLARGLSDLAAMGGTPLAAFLSLALPAGVLRSKRGQTWLAEFLEGMRKLATETRTTLAGGDTSESPADLILADIVLVGTAPRGRALRRSTAQPGDQIYVTGSLGGAHAELMALLSANRASKAKPQDVHPHFYPQPRLSVGKELLRRRIATSAIDLSDGLSTDLAHLCESSGVRAEVSSASLPLHALTQKLSRKDALHAALNGGEDYELLFSAPPTAHVPKKIAGVPITRIGSIHRKTANRARVTLVDEDGRRNELRAAGWEHLTGR